MTNNYQTASHTLTGAPATQFYGIAYPTGIGSGTNATLDFTTGKKAVEYELVFPQHDNSGVGCSPFSFASQFLHLSGTGAVLKACLDGTLALSVYINNAETTFPVASAAALPSRIGFEMDADSGTAVVYFDNVPQVLTANTFTPGSGEVAVEFVENTDSSPADTGKVVSLRLITKAADMTTNYSAGTTDPFGAPAP